MLYSSAQNEIEALKEKVAMLEKKLASSRSTRNGGIVGSAMYQAIIDNQNPIYTADGQKNKDGSCDDIMNDVSHININNSLTTSSNAIYIRTDNQQFTTPNDRNLSSYTPMTVQLNQLKENDLSLSVTRPMSSKRKSSSSHSHTSSIESVDQIIQDSDLFCGSNSIASMGKYIFDQKTGERIWIASVTNPTTLYSSLVSDSSRNTRDNGSSFPSSQDTESQWQDYFQAPTNVTTTTGTSFTQPQHHPLNLKWILSQNEE